MDALAQVGEVDSNMSIVQGKTVQAPTEMTRDMGKYPRYSTLQGRRSMGQTQMVQRIVSLPISSSTASLQRQEQVRVRFFQALTNPNLWLPSCGTPTMMYLWDNTYSCSEHP